MGYDRILGKGLAGVLNQGIKHLNEVTYQTDNWIALKPKEEREKIKRKQQIIKQRTKEKRKRERQEEVDRMILADKDWGLFDWVDDEDEEEW